MSGSASPATRVGDRASHSPKIEEASAGLLSAATSALAAAAGMGGVLAAAVGAGTASGGGKSVDVRDVIPKSISGTVQEGSPRTFFGAGQVPAAVAEAEPMDCHHHHDGPIQTGSATVVVDGLRLVRASDQTHCGATLCDGEPTILVGGAPASGKPPDPLAAVEKAVGVAGAAVGQALAAGVSSAEAAVRWAETLSGQAIAAVEKAEAKAEAAVGAVAAKAGALIGEASSAIGALLGGG
jgi:uncharacterized Zn-binding protein involved in type VI secretion